jgi:hypothetical protein
MLRNQSGNRTDGEAFGKFSGLLGDIQSGDSLLYVLAEVTQGGLDGLLKGNLHVRSVRVYINKLAGRTDLPRHFASS